MQIIKLLLLGFSGLILFSVSSVKTKSNDDPDYEYRFDKARSIFDKLQNETAKIHEIEAEAASFFLFLPDGTMHKNLSQKLSDTENNDGTEYVGAKENIDKALDTISKLHDEINYFQGNATSFNFIINVMLEDDIFDRLANLGVVKEPVIDVARQLSNGGKSVIENILEVIDIGCENFKAVVSDAKENLKRNHFKAILTDYITFCKKNNPIQVAFNQLLPMIHETMKFMDDMIKFCMNEESAEQVEKVRRSLDLTRSIMEGDLSEFRESKILYDSAADASMDALFKVVQQIRLTHSSGRKYRINKLH
ncbi:uncharacterized protein LOC135946493 [Cloeon dipterum]|uniref:uncharacterized protein LOC135946493 n=1 Tax=Cloeon dipterum TaxID=197152 RepID=UPI0032201440